jgi:hypothetical protein
VGIPYTNYYKLGSSVAEHDDSILYLLPYSVGRTFRVIQGYNGTFSRTGSNQYATDWIARRLNRGSRGYLTWLIHRVI